ncbi:MAG: protease inhibitor I42 family protein [Caldisericaceae bacterium]
MSKRNVIVVSVVVLVIVAAVAAIPVVAKNIAKRGQNEIYLKPGETVSIQLEENPTTGYTWHWNVVNTSVVSIESEHFEAPTSNLMGASGNHVWQIKGLKTGKTQIIFEYYRSWEQNKVDKTVTYTFIVQ